MEEVGSQSVDPTEEQVLSSEHHTAHAQSSIDDHSVHGMDHGNEASHIKVGAAVHHEELLTWESSEFIFHERSTQWYIGFGLVMLMIVAIVYLASGQDLWASSMVIVISVLAIVFSRRHPEMRRYTISTDGISVGDKHYDYSQFSSFTIMEEGKLLSVGLNPIGRFASPINMYVSLENGGQIVGLLSGFLPHMDKDKALVDRALERLKF